MWSGVFKKKTRREARHAVSMRLPLLFCILVFTIVPLLAQSAMLNLHAAAEPGGGHHDPCSE